jgi:ABC-type sugar transport system substrate-binding protein
MMLTLTACSSGGGSADADPTQKTVKIGVLVSDTTSAEALSFRSYYEKYIQSVYNVEFMYSDELTDAAAEQSAIDNFIANNCKAIISFASADRPAQIRKCAENKVYYAVATGTLSDEEYKEFAKKQREAVIEQNRAISEGIEKGVEAAKAAYEANKKANDEVVKKLIKEVKQQINAIQRVPGRRVPEGVEQLQKKLDDYQMGN